MGFYGIYPLVICYIAIENGHRNSDGKTLQSGDLPHVESLFTKQYPLVNKHSKIAIENGHRNGDGKTLQSGDLPQVESLFTKQYPLVNKHSNIAIENGHRNSGFTHENGGSFHSYVAVYQRVVGISRADRKIASTLIEQ